MTSAELAELHASCFTQPRPYNAAEFDQFRNDPTCFFCSGPAGFALGRSIADEAELLTLAIQPAQRRAGHGRALLNAFEAQAIQRGATRAFLEVASGNHAALALYRAAHYAQVGTRSAYYRSPDGAHQDAIVMEKQLSAV